MVTRTGALVPVTIAAIIIGVVGITTIPSDIKLESVEFPQGIIKIDDQILQVQIADTKPRIIRGLMFQEQLPYNQGMIFVLKNPNNYSFWMLNMDFSLDMIWFDNEGNVVHIEKNVPPCKTVIEIVACTRTNIDYNAFYVVEVTAGFVEKFDITDKSKLEIISI